MMSNFRRGKVIAVSLFSPYVITENPWTPAAVINTGSYCPASQRAAVKLLYGDAAPARKIAAKRDGLISIPEYIRVIDQINQTHSSEDL